jgi:hypothetical protein
MPIEAYWEDETRTLVRVDFVGGWSVAELTAVFNAIDRESEGRDYASILNYSRGKLFPTELMPMAKNSPAAMPPNLRFVALVVGSSPLIRMMGMFFQNLFAGQKKIRLVTVERLDEAYQAVAAFRARGSGG